MSSGDGSAIVGDDATVSKGKWTRFLPEAFGIRENVQKSPFRWCVRESAMWGIATGTTMGLHRLRMGSHPARVVNFVFGTIGLVTIPSYYFCYRTREHSEKIIETMMKANDFQSHEEMSETIPSDQDPFLEVMNDKEGMQKEFTARLKEKKEWQKPNHKVIESFKDVKKK